MTTEKVLVTGVNGCVGRTMANGVLAHEGTVIGVGRSRSISPADLYFRYRVCDLRDASAVDHLIEDVQPTYVVHAAAVSNAADSWQSPLDTVTTNCLGTLHLLEAIRKYGADVKRVLIIGSSHEYKMNRILYCRLSERTQISPNSPYGWSKHMQTNAAKMYAETYGLPVVIARTFNLLGPGCNRGVCGQLTRQVVAIEQGEKVPCLKVGDLRVERDFLDVRDAVEAYWQLLHLGRVHAGDVYNVCSGRVTAIGDIVECLRSHTDVQFPIVIDRALTVRSEPRWMCGNPAKLERATGWTPTISIEKSIDDMLHEYRAQFFWNSCDKED